jgi:hypothetical protein
MNSFLHGRLALLLLQSMWNVTPEPMMLGRLPQGYNMETALADEVVYNL